jgi:hypothetical protein
MYKRYRQSREFFDGESLTNTNSGATAPNGPIVVDQPQGCYFKSTTLTKTSSNGSPDVYTFDAVKSDDGTSELPRTDMSAQDIQKLWNNLIASGKLGTGCEYPLKSVQSSSELLGNQPTGPAGTTGALGQAPINLAQPLSGSNSGLLGQGQSATSLATKCLMNQAQSTPATGLSAGTGTGTGLSPLANTNPGFPQPGRFPNGNGSNIGTGQNINPLAQTGSIGTPSTDTPLAHIAPGFPQQPVAPVATGFPQQHSSFDTATNGNYQNQPGSIGTAINGNTGSIGTANNGNYGATGYSQQPATNPSGTSSPYGHTNPATNANGTSSPYGQTNPADDQYYNSLISQDPTNTASSYNTTLATGTESITASTFYYFARLIVLFGLVFLFTTVIPKDKLELKTKLIISIVVVVIYSSLDVIQAILAKFKGLFCTYGCGC